MYDASQFLIVPSSLYLYSCDWFRVHHIPTGEETSLYSYDECQQIIEHAVNGKLLGSFLTGNP